SVGIRTDGTLKAWGRNDHGQLNVPSGTFKKVDCGQNWVLGLRTDSTLVGWGQDNHGQVSKVPKGWYHEIGAGWFYGAAIPTIFSYHPEAQQNVQSGSGLRPV